MYSAVTTAAHIGLQGYKVRVEVHIANGLPRFKIVGLPDKSVEEAKERVTAAIKSSGYTFPLKRITVNLSPTDIPKHGSSFDLPIAVGILIASGQVRFRNRTTDGFLIFGEVSLDGSLRESPGAPIRIDAIRKETDISVICPKSASVLQPFFPDIHIIQCTDLKSSIAAILHPDKRKDAPSRPNSAVEPECSQPVLSKIAGNTHSIRALLISASGLHHIGLYGPPGTGKTLHGHALTDILPPLDKTSKLTLLKIYNLHSHPIPQKRPFRAPHHSTTPASIFGSSAGLIPGEISLAHKGILLLDEFPDYRREVLLGLRSVLDARVFRIKRHNRTVTFPADFILVTTMNNCPCGYCGHPVKKCTCSPATIDRYRNKIPGALHERIDLNLHLSIDTDTNNNRTPIDPISIERMQATVKKSWRKQKERGIRTALISYKDVPGYCQMSESARRFLEKTQRSLGLSMRGFLKTVRIARTISDIEDSDIITDEHIAEAVSYRERNDD